MIEFAVRIIEVCRVLPSDETHKHIHSQLVRSGMAPAPHYGEARGAESDKDFIHKLRIALKELNESRIWLKIIIKANLIKQKKLENLLDKCDQLCRILSASIHTVRNKH
ncbi:MAG: four helix bundle protein [Chloroflexota bacterium]